MSSPKLHARLRASEAYSFLQLRGVIDEDNSLDRLLPRITGNTLVIDTSDVIRINSCGVRDWVNWLSGLYKKGVIAVLIRCSPAIVNQINLVTNFSGHSIVHSFHSPYYCEACDKEIQKLVETDTLLASSPVRAPSFRCGDCGSALEFDDLEESFFAFINATDPDAIDHRLKRLVDQVSPDLEAKIRALNETGSSPLSGPLHTYGGTADTPAGPNDQDPVLPAAYLDIDEEPAAPAPRTTTPATLNLAAPAPDAPKRTTGLHVALVVSAVVVILLLVYLAATGV